MISETTSSASSVSAASPHRLSARCTIRRREPPASGAGSKRHGCRCPAPARETERIAHDGHDYAPSRGQTPLRARVPPCRRMSFASGASSAMFSRNFAAQEESETFSGRFTRLFRRPRPSVAASWPLNCGCWRRAAKLTIEQVAEQLELVARQGVQDRRTPGSRRCDGTCGIC